MIWKEDRIYQLQVALASLIAACDSGNRIERGAGGMSIDAQMARTVINGVQASAVEKARETLYDTPLKV